MAAKPRFLLNNAPITEAVIDFRAKLAPTFDLNNFKQLADQIGYDTPKPITLFEFGVHAHPDKTPETRQVDHGLVGWRFSSPDNLHVAQFKKDGLTFSRLAPYKNWDHFFAEATRLLILFIEIAAPQEISRLAVRFINRLPLPLSEVGDFSDFLTAPPPFPGECGVYLTNFLTHIQVQEPDSLISANVIQTIRNSEKEPDKVGVVLDIEVYETGNFRATANEVLPRFAALRDIKNRYFFASVTDKTLKIFE